MKATLKFLGVGSAFAKNNFNSNMVLTVSETKTVLDGHNSGELVEVTHARRMLIDCGRTAPEAMAAAGLQWADIDALYVTHQHADHVGGIEGFALSRYFAKKSPYRPEGMLDRPVLFANRRLCRDLWEHTLRGGLEFLSETEPATLYSYFDVSPINKGGSDRFTVIDFSVVDFVHVKGGYVDMPSYGLLLRIPSYVAGLGGRERKILISGDTRFVSETDPAFYAYRDADLIFQDCEVTPTKSGVHAHYEELKLLPPAIKARMWLYHYQDVRSLPDAGADGFAGFVEQGQEFEL